MTVCDQRLRNNMGFHPRVSDQEARKREAVLRIAEKHLTAAEFSDLVADMAGGKIDVRIYDDGIVLMRQG
jgi:hypothetical protein